MAEKGFEPLSGQLGIAGTSYRLQLGLINEKWASRILKGKDILDSYVYKDEDIAENGAPNQNLVVGWVLRTLTLPNINPYQIMKTTNALVRQALDKKEQRKVVASVEEAKDIKLEEVPESELKRPQAKGWVKEEAQKTPQQEQDEKRQAFKGRMKEKQQAEQAPAVTSSTTSALTAKGTASAEPVKTTKTSRKLPSIPSAGSEPVTSSASNTVAAIPNQQEADGSNFCPHCGKDIAWKYCPYCGKPLPHT